MFCDVHCLVTYILFYIVVFFMHLFGCVCYFEIVNVVYFVNKIVILN